MKTATYKYGYKGIETALNGLLLWLYHNVALTGNMNRQMDAAFDIIINYGKKNIPDFKPRGHKQNMADYIAKKIQWNNKFNHFTNWVKATNNG